MVAGVLPAAGDALHLPSNDQVRRKGSVDDALILAAARIMQWRCS